MIISSNLMLVMLGGAFLIVIFFIVAFGGDKSSASLSRRLARVTGKTIAHKTETREKSVALRRTTTDSAIPFFDLLIKTIMPNPDKLRARLARTGKNLALGEYLLFNLLSVFVAFLIFKFAAHCAWLVSAFLGIALGLWLPHRMTGRMGNKRLKKFLASFPEAIDTMCRGLRAGLPVTESIAAVGREMPDPVGIEFRRISDGVRMGRSLESAMWDITRRIDAPEFRFLIIAMSIQRETGGNLAETMGNLAELIRKRRQLRLKIRAMSSEARASAMIIGSLPFLMFGLLMAVNSAYMMILLNTLKGQIMLGFALGMISLGCAVMSKMISFEI